jgi:hypothetical protein
MTKVPEISNSEKKVHPRWTVHKKEINIRKFDLKNGHFHSHFHKTFIFFWTK